MWRFNLLLGVLLTLIVPRAAQPEKTVRNVLLEVVLTTYDIHRTETLVYLRVFSDGFAEAHPTHEVDFRNLTLKQAQVPPSELTKLQEIVSPSKTHDLAATYERNWGNVDFGDRWEITMGHDNAKKTVTLLNFQPFLAREKKQPYPVELERLGCMVWELRRNVFNEPLDRNYVKGCQAWGY